MLSKQEFASVSVIIPCFRCSNTIKRAVNSILNQSLLPAEIILVDDCSEDGTLQVLKEIAELQPGFITVFEMKKNQGAASARNAGWSIAQQPILAFLDSDDSWHPDKIKIQFIYLQNNLDVMLCGHQCLYISEKPEKVTISNEVKISDIKSNYFLFKNQFSTPTVMLRKNIEFRFNEGQRYVEDLRLWQIIAFSGLKISRIELPLAFVHKPLYGYSGLSSQVKEMEKYELKNLIDLFKTNKINIVLLVISIFISILKYAKRLVVIKLRSIKFK